jgi:hypothetical protein
MWAMMAMDPRGSYSDQGYRKSAKDYDDLADDEASPGFEIS